MAGSNKACPLVNNTRDKENEDDDDDDDNDDDVSNGRDTGEEESNDDATVAECSDKSAPVCHDLETNRCWDEPRGGIDHGHNPLPPPPPTLLIDSFIDDGGASERDNVVGEVEVAVEGGRAAVPLVASKRVRKYLRRG